MKLYGGKVRPALPTKVDLLLIDAETKVLEAPEEHKDELRLWLRLLTCTRLVETEVRARLREEFDTTLPRFDVLAQLERAPAGMTLGELSKRLMVSAGNITGLVDRLVEAKHIVRAPSPFDRRVQIVKLTPAGRRFFRKMAKQHEAWVAEVFDGLSSREIESLLKGLGRLKQSALRAVKSEEAVETAP
jgi:DNA-binding MarR family transcriptional regulator